MSSSVPWIILLPLGACAAGASPSSPDADEPDAFVVPEIDARPAPDAQLVIDARVVDATACSTVPDWNDVGPVDGNAYDRPASGRRVFSGPLETGTIADHLVVDLWNGYGVFADGFTTGTFDIAGAETRWEDCGLCVRVEADYDGGLEYDDHYMANGGIVTLTSVSGRLTGSLSNVTFRHITVTEDPVTSADHPDGCQTTVDSGSFDELLLDP
jgi:hypothetical protein